MSFRLEEINGIPKAVFEDEDPRRRNLLSYFLHPAPYFVQDILYEISIVERQVIESSGFDNPYVSVLITRDHVVIESLKPESGESAHNRIELSLAEAKLLLLEWGVALQRRQVEQKNPVSKGDI
jgi:hypothetical protein